MFRSTLKGLDRYDRAKALNLHTADPGLISSTTQGPLSTEPRVSPEQVGVAKKSTKNGLG